MILLFLNNLQEVYFTVLDRYYLLNYKKLMKNFHKYLLVIIFPIIVTGCNLPAVTNINNQVFTQTAENGTIVKPSETDYSTGIITPTLSQIQTPEIPTIIVPTQNSTPIIVTVTPDAEVVDVKLNDGDKALMKGDYDTARQEYISLFSSTNDDVVRSAALWGKGKVEFITGDFNNSLETLRELTNKYPNSYACSKAWFLLGEIYFSLNRYQESAEAYQNYIAIQPGVIDEYVFQRLGDSFSSTNDLSSAEKYYQKASLVNEQIDQNINQINLANILNINKNSEEALKIYDELFSTTKNDYLKAQIDLYAGRALLNLGRSEEGYARWQDAVNNYPMSYDSYSALLGLVNADQPVDDFNRGLVDYYAAQYDVALQAFQRNLSSNPENDGTVLYYIGETYRDMGEYNSAVDTLSTFIENYQKNRYWTAAWDDRATIQWLYLDNYEQAASGLEQFVSEIPGSPLASTYLFEAARIYERNGQLEKAADLWESIPVRYDGDPSNSNAWFQAGIVRYRIGNISSANKDFQESLMISKTPEDRARSLLWIGKTYFTTGDKGNASSAWEQSQQAAPDTYYSMRARDLLENREPFTSTTSIEIKKDLLSERDSAASWVKITFGLPVETNLSDLGNLVNNSYFIQGKEFWDLGMFDQAKIRFEKLRSTLVNNPADSFRFGNYLLDIGLYRTGIYVLRDLLTEAGLDDHSASLTAPIYFTHIRYGLYYSEIVWPIAQENGFDPLFVTSVIRQESLFEGFVHSSMGARGLMQIIPATGENIAKQMGWPENYKNDDLYSPYTSIKMGTYYLNSNRKYLNGDLFATLAGYNSGPGNAKIWQELANGDLDLELEVIRYSETRDYIRGIYEIYSTYRNVYGPMH